MGEERREGLSQLSSMLQLYIQQEVPNIMQELPAVDPLSLLAKVDHCSCVFVCGLHACETDRHRTMCCPNDVKQDGVVKRQGPHYSTQSLSLQPVSLRCWWAGHTFTYV